MEVQSLEPNLLHLSQAHLNLLETCPPQFQRIYLDQLASPLSPEQQEKLNWGNQFHRLMQQQQMGLSIDTLFAEDEQLQQAISSLIEIIPHRGKSEEIIWQEAEHCRTLRLDNYLLTVIYDLLLIEDDRAEIFDWKTYLQPENSEKLANNWQTRLYLYVLAETSNFLPEQISLTYWFVKVPKVPQSLTFKYNRRQHKKNKKDLTHLLSLLDRWRSSDLAAAEISFPHIPNCQENCPYYASLFSKLKISHNNKLGSMKNWQQFVDIIEEIAIE
jgi:hypothetical protein